MGRICKSKTLKLDSIQADMQVKNKTVVAIRAEVVARKISNQIPEMERNADSYESSKKNTNQREQTNVRERLLPDSPSDIAYSLLGVLSIVKNQNAFAKRAREMEKKRKADDD